MKCLMRRLQVQGHEPGKTMGEGSCVKHLLEMITELFFVLYSFWSNRLEHAQPIPSPPPTHLLSLDPPNDYQTGKGNSFTDLCTTELDGVTCEESGRAVTRFWGSNFTAYEVGTRISVFLLIVAQVVFSLTQPQLITHCVFVTKSTLSWWS